MDLRTKKALRGAAFSLGKVRFWLRRNDCRGAIAKLGSAGFDLGVASTGFRSRKGTSALDPRFDAMFEAYDRLTTRVVTDCDCGRLAHGPGFGGRGRR